MVSILPAGRTPFDVLGSQLGQSLQGVIAPSFQRGLERGQGLNAIDQLQKDIASYGTPQKGPNGEIIPQDPSKMIAALMRAQVMNPNLERSGLGTKLLDMAMAGQFPGALEQGANQAPNVNGPAQNQQPSNSNPAITQPISKEMQQSQPETAVPAEGKKSSTDIDTIANQYIGEVRPDLVNPATQYGNIATFDSEIKQDLTPQEEARLRQQVQDKYKNPSIVNSVIDRIREGIKNKYNESLAKYGFDKEKRQQIQEKWKNFSEGTLQRLNPHISKYGEEFPQTKEVLQNKYNQYAGALPVNMTPEQMHTNAMALLQNDINKIDALHTLPPMPPLHTEKDVADYISTNKRAYKELADLGFTDALKEDAILNKDMGNEEFHSLIWGDQTSKPLLNEIHSIKAPQEYTQPKHVATPQGQVSVPAKYNSDYPKQKESYISNLSDKLRKLGKDDDLMLARAMVLDSGGNIKDFGEALQEAERKGLKLSEFQKSQLQEINIPRVPPLWEIFSDKRTFMPARKAWAPWINYVRGKK